MTWLAALWCLLAHTRYVMYRADRVARGAPCYCPRCGCYR